MNTEGLSVYDYCHKRLFNYIRLKGYSYQNTYLPYRSYLDKILSRFPEPQNVGLLAIQEFASEYTNDHSRKNICVILRWLFRDVIEKPLDWRSLPYPKPKIKIKEVYSHDEMIRVLNAIENEKQKAIAGLIIDCGLRISEPCAIRLTDCNSKERRIILRSTKGDNDRNIYPSEYVWRLIKNYWNKWDVKPKVYLFEGQYKGEPYTPESIR